MDLFFLFFFLLNGIVSVPFLEAEVCRTHLFHGYLDFSFLFWPVWTVIIKEHRLLRTWPKWVDIIDDLNQFVGLRLLMVILRPILRQNFFVHELYEVFFDVINNQLVVICDSRSLFAICKFQKQFFNSYFFVVLGASHFWGFETREIFCEIESLLFVEIFWEFLALRSNVNFVESFQPNYDVEFCTLV